MNQHFFYTDSGLEIQYSYGNQQSGLVIFEVRHDQSAGTYRAILRKDDDVVYDRDITADEVDTFNYVGIPYTSNNLLNAGYIASLWNHRMLYLMYGDGDGTLYQAAAAICNAMVAKCYDFYRLGFVA